jgi:2-pyrone-4,6-dicarboxylate lactonase
MPPDSAPYCQPPDPNTKTPKFQPPPLSTDAHCHIFGPGDKYPYAEDRTYTPYDAPVERFRELQKTLGLERAVLVNASCHGLDNTVIVDAIAQSNGAYKGVANIDDTFTTAQLEKMTEQGFRGCRFNFVKHLGGAPDKHVFDAVVDRIKGLGWHLVLHMDAIDIPDLMPMLRALPVTFVVDHMGRVKAGQGLQQEPFRLLLELVKNEEKCWVKVCGSERVSTAGPPYHDSVPFARALIAAAPERVLWGTDWPHPNIAGKMPNDGDLVDLLPLFTENQDHLHKLLVDNPARLYGW